MLRRGLGVFLLSWAHAPLAEEGTAPSGALVPFQAWGDPRHPHLETQTSELINKYVLPRSPIPVTRIQWEPRAAT